MGALIKAAARRPLVVAALLFVAGTAAGSALNLPGSGVIPLAAAAALAGAGALLSTTAPATSSLLVLFAFFVAGAGAASRRAAVAGAPALDAERTVEGVASDPMPLRDGRSRFQLQVGAAHAASGWVPQRYRLIVTAPPVPRVHAGDRVRTRLLLSPPPPPLNPGAPDLAARCRRAGIVAFGSVVEGQLAVLGPPSPPRAWAERLRDRFRRLLADAIPDAEPRALIAALAIGDRSALTDETNDAFNASGLAHLLSVSGLHVAVVAAALHRALRALLARWQRVLLHANVPALACVASLPAIAGYVLLTGAEVPAVRSGIMCAALLLAPVLGRDAHGPTSLAAALLAVLAWDASALFDVSFQLSFAAVAGLMLLARPLRRAIPIAPPLPDARGRTAVFARIREALLQSVATSLAASLATALIVAGTFHRASLVAVLSNLVALPLASVLTVLCAAAAMLAAIAPLAAAFAALLAEPLARLLLAITSGFASLPFAAVPVAAPGPLAQAGWYAALAAVALAAAPRRARVALATAGFAALLAVAVVRELQPRLRGTTTVTFLSVGQGDSALVQLPGGANVLIDAGGDPVGRYDPGEHVVVPALLELGAARLDAVALSHPHPDHALGLRAVLQRLDVRELWIARAAERGPLLDEIISLARAHGARVRELAAGDVAGRFGPANFEVLHPPADAALDANNASLVLRLRHGARAFLFPGDVEAAAEVALANAGGLGADVLKAPHHGSSTSSSPEFVQGVRPSQVVFSVGRANRFGFPNPEVVARYRGAGSRAWRTDRDGAVTVATDGAALSATPFVATLPGP